MYGPKQAVIFAHQILIKRLAQDWYLQILFTNGLFKQNVQKQNLYCGNHCEQPTYGQKVQYVPATTKHSFSDEKEK